MQETARTAGNTDYGGKAQDIEEKPGETLKYSELKR